MKKALLVLTGILSIFLTSCNWNPVRENENHHIGKNQGLISIQISNKARTISPVENINLNEIHDWTITFTGTEDKTYDSIENLSGQKFYLKQGTYNVTLEGTGTGRDSSGNEKNYIVYGETKGVKIESEKSTSININVSLIKTGASNSSFSYNLILSNLKNMITMQEESESHPGFTNFGNFEAGAYLSPVKSPNQKINLTTTGTSLSNGETQLVFSKGNIDSGYYYLTAKYYLRGSEYIFNLPDSLVELSDDLETVGSYTDSVFNGEKIKNIYITNSASSYNGLSPECKMNINNAFSWLTNHAGEWSTANLYFTGEAGEVGNFMDIIHCSYPAFDVSVNNPTTTENGKKINLTVDGNDYLTFENGKIILKNIEAYLYSADSNASPIDLELDELLLPANPEDYFQLILYLNNARINLDTVSGSKYASSNKEIKLYLTDDLLTDYNELNSKYIYSVTCDSDFTGENTIELYDFNGENVNTYETIEKKTDSSPYKAEYFTVQNMPHFKIAGPDVVILYDDMSVTFTATPVRNTEVFAADTTFTWKLNDNDIESDPTKSFVTLGSGFLDGENKLTVEVTYDSKSVSKDYIVTGRNFTYFYKALGEPEDETATEQYIFDAQIPDNDLEHLLSGSFATLGPNNTYYTYTGIKTGKTVYSKLCYFNGVAEKQLSGNLKMIKSYTTSLISFDAASEDNYLYFYIHEGTGEHLERVSTTDLNKHTANKLSDKTTLPSSMFVNNEKLYLGVTDESGKCEIKIRDISFENDFMNTPITTITLNSTILAGETLATDHKITVTDFFAYNGDVYFLCKYGATAITESTPETLISRGYIGKINSNGTLDTTTKIGFTTSNDYGSPTGLFGPELVSGTKTNGVIVIQDYGLCSTDSKKATWKNQFVTVDLRGATPSISYESTDVKFARIIPEVSGWEISY